MLESLANIDEDLFWQSIELLIGEADLWMLYSLLNLASRISITSQEWASLVDRGRQRHGQVVASIVSSIQENVRQSRLLALRSNVQGATYRFFLALLLNVPNRETILRLISDYLSVVDPESVLCRWIDEMQSQNLLDFNIEPANSQFLRIAIRCPDLNAAFQTATPSRYQSQNLSEQTIEQVWNKVRSSALLKPIFA